MRATDETLWLFKDRARRWSFWRKVRNPFAGLTFWTWDSGGGLQLACRHWPHLMCWSWILSWRWPDGKGGEHHHWGIWHHRHNIGGWFVVGPLWFSWQDEIPNLPSSRAKADAMAKVIP